MSNPLSRFDTFFLSAVNLVGPCDYRSNDRTKHLEQERLWRQKVSELALRMMTEADKYK
jgi:hypothetical protein